MKRVKFTLGLMFSFLLMGMSVNAQSPALSGTLIGMGATDTDANGVIDANEFATWKATLAPSQSSPTNIQATSGCTNDSIAELVSLFKDNWFQLNISATSLTSFSLSNDSLTKITLPVSGFTSLNIANCKNLTTITNSTDLKTLIADNTKLNAVPTSATKLETLSLKNCTELTGSFTASTYPELKELDLSGSCSASAPVTIDCSRTKKLKTLKLNNCAATTIKLDSCSAIISGSFELTSSAVTDLNISENDLTSVKLDCPELTKLNVSKNNLSSIDLSKTKVDVGSTDSPDNMFEQNKAADGEPMYISIIGSSSQSERNSVTRGTRGSHIKDLTKAKTNKVTYETNLDVDTWYQENRIPGSAVIVSREPVPGYILDSIQVEGVTKLTDSIFVMPSKNVKVKAFYSPKSNPKSYGITWKIVNEEGNVVSYFDGTKAFVSEYNEISVPANAPEGTIVTFDIRTNYTYAIEDISVKGLYGKDENHSINFTGNKKDGSDNAKSSYNFRMPEGAVSITLTLNGTSPDDEKPIPEIQRQIIIKAEEVTTDIVGIAYATGDKDFTFYVNASGSEINVSTNRSYDNEGGVKIIKSDKDGYDWKVIIAKVSQTITVNVTKNTSTESGTNNEAIASDAVWTAGGTLYVRASASSVITVYNITGQVAKQTTVSGTETISLPKGIYVVQMNKKSYKVVL